MANKQYFKKRRQQKAEELARKKATRNSQAVFLIVTEGEETEPRYFKALRKDLALAVGQVDIFGFGYTPKRLVEQAIKKAQKDHYDQIFCVFDRDAHPHFEAAFRLAKRSRKPVHVIASTPCFEIWYLLHFTYTTKSYHPKEKHSPCDCLICDLKTYLPNYAKSEEHLYQKLKNHRETAKKHAAQLKT
ncbi:RloB family protein [Acanthopleuribacter pedis]|uniref:RloB domain-containing protein n=1 Tax=Acanthopleuribacter pedis TaxID=442870 RepID=A0A8J7QN62_9BACT|nr:RloB family protein [Acanthopleuribacter pedis]MBO1321488.1 RloB domain-containing protein [Acanthopleuribacter pedis]